MYPAFGKYFYVEFFKSNKTGRMIGMTEPNKKVIIPRSEYIRVSKMTPGIWLVDWIDELENKILVEPLIPVTDEKNLPLK